MNDCAAMGIIFRYDGNYHGVFFERGWDLAMNITMLLLHFNEDECEVCNRVLVVSMVMDIIL